MITRLAPAKVNLYLKVLGKRADGYHHILTLMQRVGLYDELTFSPGSDGLAVRCPGSELPEDKGNIVHRAARSLFEHVSRSPGVEITIGKNIPIAAGLGGGSSDAATTLLTLNEMFEFGCSGEELMKIGARIGADVPFFIFGKTAWATGIGERLEPAGDIPALSFLLVNPGFELSTRTVYEGLKMGLTNGVIQYNMPRFQTLTQVVRGLYNDLERVSIRLHPVISEIKKLLMEHGAIGSLMSGSGPTVFGIFRNEEDTIAAEREVAKVQVGSVFRAQSIP
ncbi:MAG: 4-(cytidine 5'-diphospho)-2-C-methyl-D-erythritol kinase [Deltaproteobacteria bacterium]|nr:4-(cytidine 5'-diphospho)-2-C-methyl-D-erythritol kinase [Deltaproteobacteria bacterium]